MRSSKDLFSEIKQDKALSLYGIALSLAYILSIYYWYQIGGINFASTDEPWCWPFYEKCWATRVTFTQAVCYFAILLIVACVSLSYFVYNKINKACIFLFLSWFLTFLLVIQDFRFRSNQFYMLSWVTLVYLFVPSKKNSLAAIIIALYFWAGRLKLNWEWISGAGLYEKLWLIPDNLIVASCIYVIILEMILIWGLLSKRKWIFWGTFTQLVIFHLQSFSQVAYWYPWLMFLLLSFFVLNRIFSSQVDDNQPLALVSWGKSAWITFVIFSVFQLNPILYAQTPLRVSSWRFMALHMFEAKYSCSIEIHKTSNDSPTQVMPVDLPLVPRMKCDPVIYWNYLKNRCRQWTKETQFMSADMKISYKRASDSDTKSISMMCDKSENIDIKY
jgi:hypothetical protein